MKISKAYKIRIYPTCKQRNQFANHFGAARFIYNYFLERKEKQFRKTKKSESFLKMCKHLTELKKQEDYLWLNELSRQSLANAIANLDDAYNKFFKKKAECPSFKNKYSKQAFKICSPICSVRGQFIHLPLIGDIKCEHNLPEEYKLFSITIVKTPTDKYFASINVEEEIPDPVVNPKKPEIGIDFGLKTFITISDSRKIAHLKPFKKLLKKVQRFARRVDRRKLEKIQVPNNKKLSKQEKSEKHRCDTITRTVVSARRAVARRKLAILHEKISNLRLDFLHKLSSKMVDESQAIYLEDLNLKGMMSRYGKGICDSGWYEFTRQLTYKGKWYGCYVGKIDRFYPSSKMCNKCKNINQGLELKDRTWVCSCGAHHDRDLNAAKNILEYGRADRNLWTGRERAGSSLIELSKQEVS